MPLSRWIRFIRAQDLVWLLLFSALFASSLSPDISEFLLLASLAVVQLAEPRLTFLETNSGKVFWIILKLVLGYVLIGYTNAINSPYWLVLVLPVVSAAATMSVLSTLLFSLLACGSYLSFLLFIDWTRFTLEPADIRELIRRVIFLSMTGILANALAEALRVQSAKSKAVAEQLAEANRNLHEAEAAVRRSDRLAALGQLAAGLAHELRNPLGTMKASAEMLSRSVSTENEVAREVAGFISSEVDRTNSLVTRFLDFVRPLQLRLARADLSQVLDRAVTLMERDSKNRGVTVYKNYSPDIPPFPLDAELMERVIYNLLMNAAQATQAGGAVTIKTRPVAGNAEISVIDRGSGIDPKLIDTIFNPFVTTKPDGIGMGLAIVSKIVDQHGGKIAVESEPGKGSVFRVYLPTTRPEAPSD